MDLLYHPHMSHCHPLHSDQCKEFLLYLLRIKQRHHTYFHLKLYTSAIDHCHITNIASSRRGESDYHKYGTRTSLFYAYDLMVFTNYFFVRQKYDVQTTVTYSLSYNIYKHYQPLSIKIFLPLFLFFLHKSDTSKIIQILVLLHVSALVFK